MRVAFALAALLSALAATAALSAATPSYDGLWSVEGTTDVGPCDKSFHGEVRVRGNEIVEATGVAQAIGAIEPAGSIWARLTAEKGVARASGRLKGGGAAGAWSSNTAYCGGRWSAKKKG
jgi:hypothetical protein